MPFVMRTLRKNKFIGELQPEWVPEGDIQADALKDLQTSQNAISVWLVDDNHNDLDRLLAAVAAAKDNLSNIDFALLDARIIEDLDLHFDTTDGEIPDESMKNRHRDITRLTSWSLTKLAVALSEQATFSRKSKSNIRTNILTSIESGYIDVEQMHPHLVKSLGLRNEG